MARILFFSTLVIGQISLELSRTGPTIKEYITSKSSKSVNNKDTQLLNFKQVFIK